MKAANNPYGCWQRRDENGRFVCIRGKDDLPGALEAKNDWEEVERPECLNVTASTGTTSTQVQEEAEVICLPPEAELRFVRKNDDGSLNSDLPWSLGEAVVNGQLVFMASEDIYDVFEERLPLTECCDDVSIPIIMSPVLLCSKLRSHAILFFAAVAETLAIV